MGIIIKESFKQTTIRIAISVVSALSVIFIYPMDRELYGFLSFVLGTAVLFMPFVVLGLGSSMVRFYPYTAKTYQGRRSFFISLLKILLVNVIVFSLAFYFFRDKLSLLVLNPDQDFLQYFDYVFPGAVLFGLVYFLVRYLSNYKKVAIPDGLQSMYRLAQPLAFVLIVAGFITKGVGIWMVYGVLIIALLILVVMTNREMQKAPDKELNKDDLGVPWKSFWNYWSWSIVGGLGSMLAFRIDNFMVPLLTDFTLTSDYSMAVFMTAVIVIPTSSVVAIAHPIVSQAWKDDDREEIINVYKKGSKNLLLIGAVMLMSLLLLLDFLPLALTRWEVLRHLKILVLILGVGKLFDMAASINGVIISHSEWYRYNTLFVMVLVFSNVILNYFLIVTVGWGIIGAAIATAISLILFNSFKAILIYIKMNSHPFDKNTIYFVLSFTFILCTNFWLAKNMLPILALLINGLLASIYFYILIFILDFAPDSRKTFNTLIGKLIKK